MTDKPVATNKKAQFNYHILSRFEAGIELKGAEVKSLREGKVSLALELPGHRVAFTQMAPRPGERPP